MRRSRAKSNTTTISLFPFLAVLLCTMGVLILMLVVAVWSADQKDQQAVAATQDNSSDQIAQMQEELQLSQLKADTILRGRDQAQTRLQQAQLRRGRIEQDLRELESRFNVAQQRLAQLDRQVALDAAAIASDIAQVEQQIQLASTTLDQAKQEFAQRPVAYSIVPHRSIHGTSRRPIYLECTEQGIFLRPGNIAVSLEELTPPVLPGNPLETVLLTVRDHWIKYNLANGDGIPYPLLVIRPGGARAYALARRAMQNWDDEFGYELVQEGVPLDFGAVDNELQKELERALRVARLQYATLRRSAIQVAAGSDRIAADSGGLRASQNGGFVRVPASGSSATESSFNSTHTHSGSTQPPSNTAQRGDSTEQGSRNPNGQFNNAPESNIANSSQGMPGGNTASPAGQASLPPLANQRGANWALPSHHQRATAYKRTIRVYCSGEQLIVESRTSTTQRQNIDCQTGTSRTATVDELVRAIWKQMESWGLAEKNGYWKPELKFVLLPGGQATYDDIRQLMMDSGFDIALEPGP